MKAMKSKRTQKIRNVLVVLKLSYASGRDLLYGISQYVRRRCRWRLHIVNFGEGATLKEIRRAHREGVDGIIANDSGADGIMPILQATGLPLVMIGAIPAEDIGGAARRVAFVRNDDIDIGRAGAEYLASLGNFASCGFVARSADARYYVPAMRERGFRDFFAARGARTATYYTRGGVERGSYADITALADWLKALPKPAAVMAETDLRATHAIEAAERAALRIPNEVALVGVDNDELLCETAEPAITSIAPDHVRLGELAADALRRLMEGGVRRAREPLAILSSAKSVVERQSARPVAPARQLVERAMAFIRLNATKGIGAADVVEHLGVSRRLADARFRQVAGESILGAILRVRLEAVRRKLRASNVSIAKITASCGLGAENYAKRLFKKRFGMSMSEYRAKRRQPPAHHP